MPKLHLTHMQTKPRISQPKKNNGLLTTRHVNSSPYSQPLVSKYINLQSGPHKSYSTSNLLDENKTVILHRRKQSAPAIATSSLENVLQASRPPTPRKQRQTQNKTTNNILGIEVASTNGFQKSFRSNSSKTSKASMDSECQLISFDVCENPETQCQEFPYEDEELLLKTDNLFTDVAKLCKEMGFNDNVLNESVMVKDLYLDDAQFQEISSFPCPSLVNSPSPTPRVKSLLPTDILMPSDATEKFKKKYTDRRNSIPTSRPVSATSEKYNLILSTLRHIEDEEQKTSDELFMESHRVKNIPSTFIPEQQQRPMSSASLDSIFSSTLSTTPIPAILENEGDNSTLLNNISPRSARQSSSSPKLLPELKSMSKSARSSSRNTAESVNKGKYSRPSSENCMNWETSDEKARNIYSFLDEVERSDRQTLFTLKYDTGRSDDFNCNTTRSHFVPSKTHYDKNGNSSNQTLDSLIKQGSVELAREVIILRRKLDDSTHNIRVLEDTLLNQRELNIRNLKNSEKDLKKRLKIQQEEFELALSRHQSFVDQLIAEKRSLHDKCEKVLKESKDSEEKHQQQIKSLQEKHLDELKRVRKIQEAAEKTRKQKWVGQKTQELKELTVKGLEPELQSIIQRHQKEMTETRAYYADEIAEIEQRYARKQTHQIQELREAFSRENEEAIRREREMLQKRHDADIQRLANEFEAQKKRLQDEFLDEKHKAMSGELKFRNELEESLRKAQMKTEIELENQKEEYDLKIANMERKHENEIRSLKDIYEAQRENWIENYTVEQDQKFAEKQKELIERLNKERDQELKEREKKLREEFEIVRSEDGAAQETRFKRLQEKFQAEIEEFESVERELKQKFSKLKTEVLEKDEEIFALKSTLSLKEKQMNDLTESNMKMADERINLTSVIRREFASQIEALEEDCRNVKGAVVELKAKHKLELESHQLEMNKLLTDKDTEIEKLGVRVKQTLTRKEETIQELSNQLEKSIVHINHLEEMLEQQRKDFVQSITVTSNKNGGACKKK